MCAVDLESVNDVFTVLCGVWVLFFKFGFAFVEAGKTDPHHTANVFLKNTADTFISLVAFWLHGYAFAFGEHNSFIGGQFFLTLDGTNMAHFFFNYVRCAVATTVALGAVNERTEPIGYLISGYVFAGFVYPVACHWVWDQQGIFSSGNSSFPVQDFAGSGVLFLLGGSAAAMSLRVIGPRAGRWTPHFKQREHNLSLTALGSFMQMVGFLGLVLGSYSSVAALREGQMAALCVVNVLLAGATAGLYSLVIMRMHRNYYDLDNMLRAAIAGMVAVSAGADTYIPGLAIMCGATTSLIFLSVHFLITRIQVDDPLQVIPVYLTSGAWGLLYAGLFSDQGVLGGRGQQGIRNNGVATLVLFLWAVAIMHPLFCVFKFFRVLRVPRFMEKHGIDKYRHELRHPHGTRKWLN